MSMRGLLAGVMVLGLTVSGCGQDGEQPSASGSGAGEGALHGTLMRFEESEKGVEPYLTRMMVTPDFLRLDEGSDAGDFVLYERRQRVIYSITRDSDQMLKVVYRALELRPPTDLQLHQTPVPMQSDTPSIGGVQPVQWRFSANSKTCYEVISVPGLLPDAVEAMREYAQTLASEQAATLENTPPEMRDDCMLSNYIFSPLQHLQNGFPIREWSYNGYRRELIDYKHDMSFAPELFVVPPGYSAYSVAPNASPAQ